MSFLEAVLSGIVQGACEFLPISSSGHLVLLHSYFGYKEPQVSFDIFLHVGTLLAILVYFRNDIKLVLTKERDFFALVLVASIPTGIIAFMLEPIIREAFVNIRLVGFMLIVTAVLLFLGDAGSKFRVHSSSSKTGLGFGKALIIGIAQGFSTLPGLSRSGATISAALISQVRKKEAIRFSFLLAIPAIIGALIFELRHVESLGTMALSNILAGTITAFFVGLVAIYYLIQAITKDRIYVFGIYCMLVGAAVIVRTFI